MSSDEEAAFRQHREPGRRSVGDRLDMVLRVITGSTRADPSWPAAELYGAWYEGDQSRPSACAAGQPGAVTLVSGHRRNSVRRFLDREFLLRM